MLVPNTFYRANPNIKHRQELLMTFSLDGHMISFHKMIEVPIEDYFLFMKQIQVKEVESDQTSPFNVFIYKENICGNFYVENSPYVEELYVELKEEEL